MKNMTVNFAIQEDKYFESTRQFIFDNFGSMVEDWAVTAVSHDDEFKRLDLIQQVMESGTDVHFKTELIDEILGLTGDQLEGYDIDSILEEY